MVEQTEKQGNLGNQGQAWQQWGKRLWQGAIALVLMLGLTGCVEAESTVEFRNALQGTFSQSIHLRPDLTTVQRFTAEQWLSAVGDRLRDLPHAQQQRSADEWRISLTFHGGSDLQNAVNRINQVLLSASDSTMADTPTTTLTVEERNWLVVQQNHLVYTLGRSPLPDHEAWTSLQRWVNWQFTLSVPWGAQWTASRAPSRIVGHRLTWTLDSDRPPDSPEPDFPEIDVTFWVLHPLGAGGAAIALLLGLGWIGMTQRRR